MGIKGFKVQVSGRERSGDILLVLCGADVVQDVSVVGGLLLDCRSYE